MPKFKERQLSSRASVEQEQYLAPEHQEIKIAEGVNELLAIIAGELAVYDEVVVVE